MKRTLKSFAGFLLLSIILTAPSYAADITVTASLDRNPISLEDQAVLTISVSGTSDAPAPALPDLPDFVVESSGQSTRVSIVNGTMSSQVDYNFTLQPRKAGDFTIGPAAVQYKGKAYRSGPVTLHVSKNSGTESGGKDLFVTTEVDRRSPYVGEQLLFRIKFFRRIDVADASLGDISFDGFQATDAGKETTYASVVDGIRYQVTEIRKLLIPSRAGEIVIPAAVLQCQVAAERRPRTPGGFFGDDFFNFGAQRTVVKTLRSRPITVQVRPLPREGKPAAFSGMVGAFQLSAKLDKKEVKKGESVTLTMKLSGTGDLSGAPRPAVKGIEQFKAYDDQPSISKKIVNERVVSEKIFKTALVPQYAGDLKFPEVSFWYFDPGTGKYRKAGAAVPGLRVLPGDERGKIRVVEGQEQAAPGQGAQVVGKDILPISTDVHSLKDETFRPMTAPLLTLLLAPPLVFLGVFVFKRRRDKRAADSGFIRNAKAMKQAQKGMEEAGLVQNTDRKKCCARLSRTVKAYLGDKLNVSGEAMTPDEIRETLQARLGQGPLAERAVNLLRELEMRQFSPMTGESEGTGKLVQEAQDVIRQLEKIL